MEHVLKCTKCGRITADYSSFRCRRCRSILEVQYRYSSMRLQPGFRKHKMAQSKYLPLFPISSFGVTLGEGGTPLVKRKIQGIDGDVFLKLETRNPTHSFKDRGSSVEISRALELGFGHVCAASTGNMGISIAAYSKAAGISSTIFISKDANPAKVAVIRRHGARVVPVNGDFNKALNHAEAFARKSGAFLCGDYHYRKEGQKGVIFEIIEQLKYRVPDFIFLPVGNATLLAAAYKSLVEFKRYSLISRFPRIVAVQSDGCDPLVKAYNYSRPIGYTTPDTVADAIAVGYPTFGMEGINALKRTHGLAIGVSDAELMEAVETLKKAGIESEMGGAAGFAGMMKLAEGDKRLLKGRKLAVVVTGSNGALSASRRKRIK